MGKKLFGGLTSVVALAASLGASAGVVELRSGSSTCTVDPDDGARIVSWKVDGDEQLRMPEVASCDGEWRHGGILPCWPWIRDRWPTNAPHSLHGLAWRGKFAVNERKTDETGDRLTLSFAADGLVLDYTVSVWSNELGIAACSRNESTEPKPLQLSFLPYLRVDVEEFYGLLTGMDGLRYHGMRTGADGVWKGVWCLGVTNTIDCAFLRGTNGEPMSISLYETDGRLMTVRSDDADMTTVWNPGKEMLLNGIWACGGMSSNDWQRFVCVGPSTRLRTLQPGETQRLSAVLTAEGPEVHAQRAPGFHMPWYWGMLPLQWQIRFFPSLQVGILSTTRDRPIVLVKGKRPMMPIVVSNDARARLAAEKLADVICEMTGGRPRILAENALTNTISAHSINACSVILVGHTRTFRNSFEIDPAALAFAVNDRCLNFGHGDPVAVVNFFCEEVLGVREKDGRRQVVKTDGLSMPALCGAVIKMSFVIKCCTFGTVVVMLVALLVFWLLGKLVRKRAPLPKMPLGKSLLKTFGTYLWLIPVSELLSVVIAWLGRLVGWESEPQLIVRLFSHPELTPQSKAVLVVLILVLAPVLEELVFRRYLFRWLLGHMRPVLAAVASGAVFALMHDSLEYAIPIWLLGIVLARVYHCTGRLSCAMLLHFLSNLTAVLLMLT